MEKRGLVMIATHNLFDSVRSSNPLWSILHSPNVILSTPTHTVFVAYPLIPWIGVTAAGFGLGQIYGWPSDRRRTFLLRLGIGLTSGFVILRAINIYGDPSRWTTQHSSAFTILSFLNTTKYPPSLLILLMTLGPALIFLWAVDTHTPRILRPALVIGKVPLFLPVALYLHSPTRCHPLLRPLRAYPLDVPIAQPRRTFPSPSPRAGDGTTARLSHLGRRRHDVPLCRWFAAVKQRSNAVWLSYFDHLMSASTLLNA
jgi:hypothetical protein